MDGIELWVKYTVYHQINSIIDDAKSWKPWCWEIEIAIILRRSWSCFHFFINATNEWYWYLTAVFIAESPCEVSMVGSAPFTIRNIATSRWYIPPIAIDNAVSPPGLGLMVQIALWFAPQTESQTNTTDIEMVFDQTEIDSQQIDLFTYYTNNETHRITDPHTYNPKWYTNQECHRWRKCITHGARSVHNCILDRITHSVRHWREIDEWKCTQALTQAKSNDPLFENNDHDKDNDNDYNCRIHVF